MAFGGRSSPSAKRTVVEPARAPQTDPTVAAARALSQETSNSETQDRIRRSGRLGSASALLGA